MKSTIIKTVIFFAACLSVCAAKTQAEEGEPKKRVNVSIGASIWYAWWQSPLENSYRRKKKLIDEFYQKSIYGGLIYQKSEFFYGPVISLTIDSKWTLSGVFMYANGYGASSKNLYYVVNPYYPGGDISWTAGETKDLNKYDLDVTLSYTLNQYAKVFAGFKYQGYDSTGSLLGQGPFTAKLEHDFYGMGPGAGIAWTFHLFRGLHLLTNMSGIYLRSRFLENFYQKIPPMPRMKKTGYYNACGANGSLALAYYIDRAHLTISLGFRYQYLYYLYDSGRLLYLKDEESHFYGLTFSLVYTF